MAKLPTSLKPVDKADIRAELSARAERPSAARQAQRQEVEQTLRRWLGIGADDRARQSREQRQIDALAEPIRASLVYRGGIMRQSLRRVARVVDSGLGEKEQVELLALIDGLDPARHSFEMNPIRRLIARLPGVGSRFQRWYKACLAADADIAQMGERMVAAREPFKHTIARLARVLGEVRELLHQLREQLDAARMLHERLVQRMDSADSTTREAILSPLAERLQQRLQLLQRQYDEDHELVLAVEVLVRNARRLIGGQRQAVNAVRTALGSGRDHGRGPTTDAARAALNESFAEAREQLLGLGALRDEALVEIAELCREHDRRGD